MAQTLITRPVPSMTRAEAHKAVKRAILAEWKFRHPGWQWHMNQDDHVHDFLSGLEALGLLLIAPEPTEDELINRQAVKALTGTTLMTGGFERLQLTIEPCHARSLVDQLRESGLQIVRAP